MGDALYVEGADLISLGGLATPTTMGNAWEDYALVAQVIGELYQQANAAQLYSYKRAEFDFREERRLRNFTALNWYAEHHGPLIAEYGRACAPIWQWYDSGPKTVKRLRKARARCHPAWLRYEDARKSVEARAQQLLWLIEQDFHQKMNTLTRDFLERNMPEIQEYQRRLALLYNKNKGVTDGR